MAFSFQRFFYGISIVPTSANTTAVSGDLQVTSADGKLNYFNAIDPLDGSSPVVTEAHTSTLTNKSMSGSANTFTNISPGSFSSTTGTGAVVLATSPTLVTPALGTPSALVGTNITGTAAGLTAGTVTTNANLTGPITSVGNTTSVALQTGTGSTFVMDTSPTLVTPNLGTPSAVVLTNATGTASSLVAGNINATSNGTIATLSALSLPLSQTTGVATIAQGGTDNASLPVTAGGVLYTDGTKVQNTGAGSSGQVLTSAGSGEPTWTSALTNPMSAVGDMIVGGTAGAANRLPGNTTTTIEFLSSTGTGSAGTTPVWTGFIAPTIQAFNQINYYTFTVTSANATVGATYTNNGATFTVNDTIVAGTTLVTYANGSPTSSGTLTKTGGTGDATIAFSSAGSYGTYSPTLLPRPPLYIKIRMVGGGGGGSGSSNNNAGPAGGNGEDTTWNSTLLIAGGGAEGSNASPGGGGGVSFTSGPTIVSVATGNPGNGGAFNADFFIAGGSGGASPFGGLGVGGAAGAAGGNAFSGSGSGGGGGGWQSGGDQPGAGGGAGGYLEAMIANPSTSYTFSIGLGGGAGGAGSGGQPGGAGANGQIIVEEYYQ